MDTIFRGICVALVACTQAMAQSFQEKLGQKNDSLPLQRLNEVVVSDSRFELKRAYSGKTVIKIGEEELQQSQGRSVAEIINTKSGLEISGSRGVQGSVLGVYARGGRGRQVLIVIDGVRVTDPSSFSGEYDLRLLTSANVASIEIIKGAASTLYGANAATATIIITTKKASPKKMALQITSSLGTNQTAEDQNFNVADFSNNAQLGGTLNKFSYLFNVSQNFTNGLSALVTPENEEDVFSNVVIDLRLGYDINDRFKIGVFGGQTRMRTDFDDSFGMYDAPYRYLSEQKRVGTTANFKYSPKGALFLNAAFNQYRSESQSAFPNEFNGQNVAMDFYHKYSINDRFFSILGVNYVYDAAEFAATENFKIIDPYLNLVYITPFGLNANGGFRVNTHSAYGAYGVYTLNPSFTMASKTGYLKFLSSYATSYITPSLTQLFGAFGPNPNLKPESNRTTEVGLEVAKTKGFRASALYFNRKETNFVFFDNATFTYQNADNTIDAQGFELELEHALNERWVVSANYTFTERKGDNAIRIPKHKVNASLVYTFSQRLGGSLQYTHTGARPDTDFNQFPAVDMALGAYSLVDAQLNFELLPQRMHLFVNASNILNGQFTEVLGFSTRGRNVRMGFRLDLD